MDYIRALQVSLNLPRKSKEGEKEKEKDCSVKTDTIMMEKEGGEVC